MVRNVLFEVISLKVEVLSGWEFLRRVYRIRVKEFGFDRIGSEELINYFK